MKRIYPLIACFTLFFSCTESQRDIDIIIEEFPKVQKVKLKEHIIPEVLLSADNMIISGEHLIVLQSRLDTVFYSFSLKDLAFEFSCGNIGEGPDEVSGSIDIKTLVPTTDGMKVFDSATGKEIFFNIDSNAITVDQSKGNNIPVELPANGFISINDTLFASMASLGKNHEWLLQNTQGTFSELRSPYPDWDGEKDSENIEVQVQRLFSYFKFSVTKPDDHSRIASFYPYFKRMRIFDSSLNIVRDVEVKDGENWMYDKDRQTTYYDFYPFATSKYIINLCNSKRNGVELHVFNWDGDPVAKYILDRKLDIFTYSNSKRTIYGVEKDKEDRIYSLKLDF